jgi:hypothetical protein
MAGCNYYFLTGTGCGFHNYRAIKLCFNTALKCLLQILFQLHSKSVPEKSQKQNALRECAQPVYYKLMSTDQARILNWWATQPNVSVHFRYGWAKSRLHFSTTTTQLSLGTAHKHT